MHKDDLGASSATTGLSSFGSSPQAVSPLRASIPSAERLQEALAKIKAGHRCLNLVQEGWGQGYQAATKDVLEHLSPFFEAARFLCERLREFEAELADGEPARQFFGHVVPALARFEAEMGE